MKVNTYWLGNAISFARDIKAHQYHIRRNSIPTEKRMLKRLWWCCIIRDRILPLGVRRPLKIGSEDFDFQADPIALSDFDSEIRRSKVYDTKTKTELIQLFVAVCELSVSITDVIMMIYPPKGCFAPGFTKEEASRTFSRIAACKARLDEWYERTIVSFPTPAGIRDAHKSIVLYTNMLYVYYQ
jgi:hypothetical protein